MSLARYQDLLSDAIVAFPAVSKTFPEIDDPYVARSLLQKALRRGDVARAIQAAHSLLEDPQRLWKGLAVTVFEDFGSTSVDVRGQVVAACASKKFRSDLGGDLPVARALIHQLCEVPRDRRVDEVYMFAGMLGQAPLTSKARRRLSPELRVLLSRARELILRCERPVPQRSFKTVLAKECDAFLIELYEYGRLSEEELAICVQGRKTTQCLLPVLYPLTRPVSARQGAFSFVTTYPSDLSRDIAGAPSYALDGYTRAGKQALEKLFRANSDIQKILKSLTSRSRQMKALAALLFVVEGGLCTAEVSDPLYDEIKHISRGRWTGLPADVISEALEVVQVSIPELNNIRELVYAPYVP